MLPGVSTSARHAARRIRRGIERGDREVRIGAFAHVAALVDGLLPGWASVMARLLPAPGGDGAEARAGGEIRSIARPREPLPAV